MKYIVTGRVHPERADVSFQRVEMKTGSGGKAAASCDSSQITIVIDDPAIDGWITAHVVADDIANIFVGALGFSLGCGYSVELIQVTEEDGTPHVFGVRPEGARAGENLGFNPHIPEFNRAIHLAGKNIFFRLAVRDYLRAIRDIKDCPSYCYRAIEGIKSAIVSETGNDKWEDMHAVLGTDRTTIEGAVKAYADPVRHGNWINARSTNHDDRWRMLSITRDVLWRYLNYAEPPI